MPRSFALAGGWLHESPIYMWVPCSHGRLVPKKNASAVWPLAEEVSQPCPVVHSLEKAQAATLGKLFGPCPGLSFPVCDMGPEHVATS